MNERIERIFRVKPEEIRSVLWAWLYFSSILSAYYILRPIRDELGVSGGTANLSWLFTATLVTILLCNFPFAALTKKLTRERLIRVTYRFFILHLLLFVAGFHFYDSVWLGRIFFIWTSVFNLFIVSVFWILMVDVFRFEQGSRLFGLIAAGGTVGAVLGSGITASLAHHVSRSSLLLASAALVEFAVYCATRLSLDQTRKEETQSTESRPIEGSILSGLSHAFKSKYLFNISLYTLLFTITSTSLYFQQAEIIGLHYTSVAARTALFAKVDLAVNSLTLFLQIFFTTRILSRLGVALTLAFLPMVSAIGFLSLALSPTIVVLAFFQIVRRASNFAVAKPTQELLFTVVAREDKYRAKSFIDTVVYRAGDQLGAWSQALLALFGMGATGTALVAVPVSIVWLLNGLWLGIRQKKMDLR